MEATKTGSSGRDQRRDHLEGVVMLRRLVHVVLVVALGTALATAALTAPAVAQEPPTFTASLTGAATLVAKGAAVDVEVAYSCSPGTTLTGISIELTQRVGGGRLATGSGSTSGLVCDGAEHTTTVRVIAEGSTAFKKGSAVGQGNTEACNEFGCVFGRVSSATVQVR
jgi:hypothetical protein